MYINYTIPNFLKFKEEDEPFKSKIFFWDTTYTKLNMKLKKYTKKFLQKGILFLLYQLHFF